MSESTSLDYSIDTPSTPIPSDTEFLIRGVRCPSQILHNTESLLARDSMYSDQDLTRSLAGLMNKYGQGQAGAPVGTPYPAGMSLQGFAGGPSRDAPAVE